MRLAQREVDLLETQLRAVDLECFLHDAYWKRITALLAEPGNTHAQFSSWDGTVGGG